MVLLIVNIFPIDEIAIVKLVTSNLKVLLAALLAEGVVYSFLFRSARTSCTTFGWSVRPFVPQEKSGSLIYRHVCLES